MLRRSLLLVVLVGAACAEPPVSQPQPAEEEQQQPTPEEKPLPAVSGPRALKDVNPDPKVVEVNLVAGVSTVELDDGRKVQMYLYNEQLPGPLLQARVGDRVLVHFKNNLPEETTIHWHGLRISDAMDGSPRIQQPVKPGETFTYDFVVPEAGSFWYHPHVRAHVQVERGLYGAITFYGDSDPEYDGERYLVLDDLLVNGDGSFPAPLTTHPERMHGRFGDTLLTNGRINGQGLTETVAAGRIERWRIVNTSNARTMSLSLHGAKFRVIGTDGGLVPHPFTTDRLQVGVGQRFDLEVTLTEPGTVELKSWVLTQNAQNEVVEVPIVVYRTELTPSSNAPKEIVWPSVPGFNRSATEEASVTIDAVQDPVTGVAWRLNGISQQTGSHHHAPLFVFKKGSTVRLRLINNLGPYHPFHLHGQFFHILDNGSGKGEPGLKDTVLVPGMGTVEVLAYMDNPGRWMAHCHILEHAELGMMSEIVVEP